MSDIKELFKTAIRAPQNGIEGYHYESKYFDARRSREQKKTNSSREGTSKPLNVSPKSTFIDEVRKRSGKLPGPTSYEPHASEGRNSVKGIKVQSPPRMTIFDEMTKMQKKLNIPAAGVYDKVQEKNKANKSWMNKAELCTYLESSMRKSIERPGVGQYNPKLQTLDKKGVKLNPDNNFGKKRRSASDRGIRAPEACTYNPVPVAYGLFESISGGDRKKARSYFNRQERFKTRKEKCVPFYDVTSEWGMKNNLHKKDILSRVGSSLTTHQSIYY